MKLSVVIPAFNEARRLPATLAGAIDFLTNTLAISYEIIVVDDGSADDTANIVTDFYKHNPAIKVIRYDQNHGKGYALKTGISESNGDLVLTVDADGSTPFGELSKLLDAKNEFDGAVIIGSRHLPGSQIVVKQPWYRILISRVANKIIRLSILPGIQDTQCGFKLFKGNVAREIFSKTTINGFGNDMEVLIIAKELGYSVIEVPVTWLDSKDSTLRPIRSTLKTFIELIRILYHHKIQMRFGRKI